MSSDQYNYRQIAKDVSTFIIHAKLIGDRHGLPIKFEFNVDTDVLQVVDDLKKKLTQKQSNYEYKYIQSWFVKLEEFKSSLPYKPEEKIIALFDLLEPFKVEWTPKIYENYPTFVIQCSADKLDYHGIYSLNQQLYRACIGKETTKSKYIMFERCNTFLKENSHNFIKTLIK